MKFEFTVRGDRITENKDYSFTEGNKGFYEAVFTFSEEWEGFAKLCVVEQGDKVYTIVITDRECFLPEMERGTARIGVIGTLASEDGEATTISTNMCTIGVLDGAAGKEANSQLNTAAEVWEKYLVNMEDNRKAAETAMQKSIDAAGAAATSANESRGSANSAALSAEAAEENAGIAVNAAGAAESIKTDVETAKGTAEEAAKKAENAKKNLETAESNAKAYAESAGKFATTAEGAAADAKVSSDNAAKSEENAKASEEAAAENKTATEQLASRAETAAENAEESETNSAASQKSAEQALADLLAMINSGDIVLATNGKLPLSAIPATATQEIYTVTSEEELTSLTAQRGDLAELIEKVDGEQTITKTWQCLGDSLVRENWVVWGTSYAVQAGNATVADNALNANMINNHRIVEMTEEEFSSAVKDENTYYLVY